MTLAYVLAGVTAVLLAVFLVLEKKRVPHRVWVKGAASAAFIGTALAAGAVDSAYGGWILSGLCLGAMGDVSLELAHRRWFLIGLAAFLCAQLTYVGAFATVEPSALVAGVAAAGLLVPASLVTRWLWPHLDGGLRAPVLAYIAVITAMVAAAAGAVAGEGPVVAAPAAVAFYVSDLFVARDRFVARGFVNRLLGLPLYYGAQVVFALSVGRL
jgi:uncharacterized membrane protein YhhN